MRCSVVQSLRGIVVENGVQHELKKKEERKKDNNPCVEDVNTTRLPVQLIKDSIYIGYNRVQGSLTDFVFTLFLSGCESIHDHLGRENERTETKRNKSKPLYQTINATTRIVFKL